jgi:UDPglucose--hexose-1-phosphate uridylyltransferase
MKVQLRFDRQTGQWIIVAALRQYHTHITTLAECQLCTSTPGHGRCEVIVFSSDHTGSFAELEPTHARLVVEAWRRQPVCRQPRR